jgi:Uma2 family endonuclease
MSVRAKTTLLSEAEYLAFERASDVKHQYDAGEIFAMAGATERHNLIAGNVFASLHRQLRRHPYNVYPSDMRVKLPSLSIYTYPDVTVVCGGAELEDETLDTLLNPTVVVEVLSPSTESYDRGRKSQGFRSLPSLREYLLIAQDAVHVEQYVRQPDGRWILSEEASLGGTIHLASIGCDLEVAEIYEKTDLVVVDEPGARTNGEPGAHE